MTTPTVRLSRIDLRGPRDERRAAACRPCPRGVDVDAVVPTVRRLWRTSPSAAPSPPGVRRRFDGIRPDAVRVAAGDLTPRWPSSNRRSAPPWRWPSSGPAPCTPTSAAPITPPSGPGATVTERWVPVERVGLYVPGGTAVYPSSVVMNVVPAQAAGWSPWWWPAPQADFGGLPHPTILAAAALLGVDEVWAVGGAQAVALLAYGGVDTDGEELAPVDMITGPGNIYVTAAKRICCSQVGIDSEAGPTEIAILADTPPTRCMWPPT